MGADARLGSQRAQHEAANAIVDTLLGVGLDHLVVDEALQQAVINHRQRATLDRSDHPVPLYLERSRVKSHEQLCVLEVHDKRPRPGRAVARPAGGADRDIGTDVGKVAGKVGKRLARRQL